MTFKEYLESKGLSDEQVTAVLEDMGNNKFYLSTEEKLDERYNKLKAQKEKLEQDAEATKQLIEQIKSENADSEELKAKVAEYETKLQELEVTHQSQLKDNAIQLALTQAGAKNAKAVKALLDLDNIVLKDGEYTGLSDQLEAVKKDNEYLFNTDEANQKPNFLNGSNTGGGGGQEKTMTQRIAERLATKN